MKKVMLVGGGKIGIAITEFLSGTKDYQVTVADRDAASLERMPRKDNVALLPHVGSATRETRQAMADLCKANLDAWFDGGRVLTLVAELR